MFQANSTHSPDAASRFHLTYPCHHRLGSAAARSPTGTSVRLFGDAMSVALISKTVALSRTRRLPQAALAVAAAAARPCPRPEGRAGPRIAPGYDVARPRFNATLSGVDKQAET